MKTRFDVIVYGSAELTVSWAAFLLRTRGARMRVTSVANGLGLCAAIEASTDLRCVVLLRDLDQALADFLDVLAEIGPACPTVQCSFGATDWKEVPATVTVAGDDPAELLETVTAICSRKRGPKFHDAAARMADVRARLATHRERLRRQRELAGPGRLERAA